jgi:biopolymer transport protein ExbB
VRTLAYRFEDGGPIMWAILAVHLATVGVFAWRITALLRVRWGSEHVVEHVLRALRGTGLAEEALRLRGLARTPIGRVLFVGLLGANRSIEHVVATMSAVRVAELSKLRRGAGWLNVSGTASVMLGLLGSVYGLSYAFWRPCCSEGSTWRSAMAAAVSESANCSAFGLYTAITAAVAYALSQATEARVISDLDAGVASFVNTLHDLRPWLRLHGTRPSIVAPTYRS